MLKKRKYYTGNYAHATDLGKIRINNEDQALALTNAQGNVLLIVCDGMGGQNKGDLASSLAINLMKDEFKEKNKFLCSLEAYWWLNKTLKLANTAVYEEANKNPAYKGMGTTISIALIYKSFLFTAHVGDSRIYRLNNGELEQISEDQTYVAYLYRTGQISKEDIATHPKRSILMNALGIYPTLNAEHKCFKYKGEKLLICSDGLYNNVDSSSIKSVLNNSDSVEQKVSELISIANNNGGSDNIAIVLWECHNEY